MPVLIGQFAGALIPTLLVSRLLLWVTRKWNGGVSRYLAAHLVSLLIASLLGGMGRADGGAFAPIEAAAIYIGPQVVWLLVDLIRFAAMSRTRPMGQRNTEASDVVLEATPVEVTSGPTAQKPSSGVSGSVVFLGVMAFLAVALLLLRDDIAFLPTTESAPSSSDRDTLAVAQAELILDCAGHSGSPSYIARLRRSGAGDPLAAISDTRVVLRVVPEYIGADLTDPERRALVITDHAPTPSAFVATVGSCNYTQCDIVMDANQISVRAVIEAGSIAPEGVRLLRISRATGEYSASVNIPRREEVDEPGLQMEEFGTCAPRARQF